MRNQKVTILLSLLALSLTVEASHLQFSPNARGNHQITIAAVGDVLLHRPLQIKAQRQGFMSLWKAALPYLQKADMSYANLEGPVAMGLDRSGRQRFNDSSRWDSHIYTGHPTFNYHPSLVDALSKSGIDIVSIANNHSLDRFSKGLASTQSKLREINLAYTGARSKGSNHPWYSIIKRNGISVAWLGCAEHINGITDKHRLVMRCYAAKDKVIMLNTIRQLKTKVGAIIVVPHWGQQYSFRPQARQKSFAHQVLNAGALAVLGSHPHCLQPWEKYMTKDGRETFIDYSLGNFVSNQGSLKNRASAIVLLRLVKLRGNRTVIRSVNYAPTYMQNRSGIPKIRLTLLTQKNKSSAPMKLIRRILPSKNGIIGT